MVEENFIQFTVIALLVFRFGNVCYISDVSEIPEETYPLLKDCEILVMDALRPDRSSTTHFGLPRALGEVRKIQPKRALFTGMMHLMDHDKVSEDLAKLKETEGLDVQLICWKNQRRPAMMIPPETALLSI